MRDPSDGMFYWSVSRDGKAVVAANKALVAQLFAVYALAEYAAAFADAQAKQYALQCFKSLDAKWYNNTTGGFNERFSNSLAYGDTANAAQQKDADSPRSMNSIMHGILALTALHKVTQDQVVLNRLLEHVTTLCNKLPIVKGHLYGSYSPSSNRQGPWTPVTEGYSKNYGADLQTAWLGVECVDYLESIKVIPSTTAASYRTTLMSIAAAAIHDAYDEQYGGFFYSGSLTGPVDKTKTWYVQTEAVLALWKLYKYNKNDQAFLQKLAKSVAFLRKYMIDRDYGEMFWSVAQDGNSKLDYQPGPGIKGNKWKASYHSGRAMINLSAWISQELKG